MIPSLEHQSLKSTQVTTSGEKQQGCSLPETDNGRPKGHLKGQYTHFHLQALTRSSHKGGGRVAWKRLRRDGDESLGERTERVAPGILVLSHPPDGSNLCAQADDYPLRSSSLRGNNSPDPGGSLPWLFGA